MNKCLHCSKPAKNKFCSKSCANIQQGRQRVKGNSGRYIQCSSCKKEKPPSEFSYLVRRDSSSGRRSYCKRCGANERERRRRERTWRDDAALAMLNNSKQRAKRSGLEHTLTKDDIEIPEVCPVLGIKISTESRFRKKSGPSIDRIDNSKGYTKDNIVIVSCRANLLKKDATISELINLAKFYADFLP